MFRFLDQIQTIMEIELVTLQDLENLKKEILTEMKKMLEGHKSEPEKRWLKSSDVQKLLGISQGTLQTLRNRSMIPFTRLGGVIYYSKEEVKKVLEKPEDKSHISFGKSR